MNHFVCFFATFSRKISPRSNFRGNEAHRVGAVLCPTWIT